MRKRTVRLLLTALAGACAGAVIVFALLAALGAKHPPTAEGPSPTSASPNPSVVGSPSPSLSPAPPSASPGASPSASLVKNAEGGYAFALPAGYRVAEEITTLERSQVPASATLTITKGSKTDEHSYVALIEKLRSDQTATEAPVFSPGRTMTLLGAAGQSEASDRQLSRAQEAITTATGLAGTRYRRVEGLFTYDMTYLMLPGGKRVSIQMSYAPQEPLFDEKAYQAVLDSVRSLIAGE